MWVGMYPPVRNEVTLFLTAVITMSWTSGLDETVIRKVLHPTRNEHNISLLCLHRAQSLYQFVLLLFIIMLYSVRCYNGLCRNTNIVIVIRAYYC